MKDPQLIDIDECIARLDRFDTIVDARSPSEFAEDCLPGAVNAPVLDDAQRAIVGTDYKQSSPFEARRLGAALVSRNIARIVEEDFADRGREWQPLVYCWRGGNRSNSLATVMARIGWRVCVLDGGYRAFRRRVVADLARLPQRFRYRVIAGRTGSAKSRLLRELAARGEQILDLEALACHRGSVLGDLPGAPQPSQKQFETRLWERLRALDPSREVFVESESRKVGQCQVPPELIVAMRASRCVRIEASRSLRARLLLDEYEHFTVDREGLFAQLDRLTTLHGHERIAEWKALAIEQRWQEFVEALLGQHYDPAYDRSMNRNFGELAQADAVRLEGGADEDVARAATRIVEIARGGAAGA